MQANAAALRQRLHERAEPAFAEKETSRELVAFLREHGVTIVADDVAGHGILCRVGPEGAGPLLRSDMDALPDGDGARHACGHDGHMAMLAAALAAADGTRTIHAIFQPAEETGEGAAAALADPRLELDVTQTFAIHNVPGLPLGSIHVREGPAAVASCGLEITFEGATSHAGEPHQGRSPVAALTALAAAVEAAPRALPFQHAALGTVVGLEAGGRHYGTSPGRGILHATLRASSTDGLEAMLVRVESCAQAQAAMHRLECATRRVEPFPACRNDPAAVAAVARPAAAAGLPCEQARTAPWSEDFGHFLERWPGALVLLGSGDRPDLHSPDYTFPDDLLEAGTRFWTALAEGA